MEWREIVLDRVAIAGVVVAGSNISPLRGTAWRVWLRKCWPSGDHRGEYKLCELGMVEISFEVISKTSVLLKSHRVPRCCGV